MTPDIRRDEKAIGTQLLRRALSDDTAEFRDGQWEAIDAAVNRRKKLLVVQRTGWGKSSVYFIATRILRDRGAGPTLIVSPLLALMRNQLDAAERLGIRAFTINSTNRDEWPDIQAHLHADETDAILISPERLANDEFVQAVLLPVANRIGLVVVDEAHCISDWGHDFRPDYRRLVAVLRQMPPSMPVLGTTATANDRVIADVQAQLGDLEVHRGPLTRTSLSLEALRLPDQAARLAWLVEHVPEIPGTGIVYTLTKRDAEQVADWLNSNGIDAKAYYGDVTAEGFPNANAYRQHLESLLLGNRIKVLVATTALGMGYDKPDLAFVVHYQAPGSIIAYYQQVGRAGRMLARAVGVLLSGAEDDDIHAYFRRSAFPTEGQVSSLLELLGATDGLTVPEIEGRVNLRHGQIEQMLKILSVETPAPVIKDGARWKRTPIRYVLDRERIEHLTGQKLEEWQELQRYIDAKSCRMVYLARALDDHSAENCGRCDNCLGRPILGPGYSRELGVAAVRHLRRADLPLTTKARVPREASPAYGFTGNLPATLRAEQGRILSRWGDAGWGRVVADAKHAGHFGDELVEALVEMVRDRWQPTPAPAWVTCVPSRRHPELVPDFARRLAERLEIPFVAAVTKVRDNEAQKLQQNTFHQCHNLDGAFEIVPELPQGPVLLVDDIVDSRWTMTAIAALLRRRGSGPVWPVALSTTNPGD
jgi:ATP-dependent DNA helicase RecQ